MFALQDWKTVPFKTFGDEAAGMAGGVAPAANGIVFVQSAVGNVDRVVSASSTMNLVQVPSDWWRDSGTHAISFVQAAVPGQDKPRAATSNLALTQHVHVLGGIPLYTPVHEIIADGVVLAGQVIYIKGTGNAGLAQADAAATAFAVGIAAAAGGGIVTGTLYYQTQGFLTLLDWTQATGATDLTPGSIYYVSAATEGDITATPPTGDGEFVVKVGTALDARTLNLEIGEGVAL